ncbi:MAG: aspartate--ammonia ligase [Muribaculaceae bacterium]|nr:aspartate--ammonia ligase [Muribaculaceae bacterium]
MSLIIPAKYKLKLLPETTEIAIQELKNFVQQRLFDDLNLRRVTAPLFVASGIGLNDDLNGVERPVSFEVGALGGERVEIVQSLAKWKRVKLAEYDIAPGYGIYTDMNAVRPDEQLDNLHSLYVDQWDWERVITPEQRTVAFLKEIVEKIYCIIRDAELMIYKHFPHIVPTLPESIKFIRSQELLDMYPGLSPKEREREAARRFGAVFIIGIGAPLSDGVPHDHRAPDYDDWSSADEDGNIGLNGDIIVWDPVLDCPLELSSMGIRTDAAALRRQLEASGCNDRLDLWYHSRLLEGRLPLSIGGGIGQSRLSMFLLQKAHIGEVQASVWPADQIEACAAAGIPLI